MSRTLIVNADDLGQSEGINRGILKAHADGIVTSASVMVRWPDARDGCTRARDAGIGLGLHLDLGEWAFRDAQWAPIYEVVSLDDEDAVRDEVHRQVDAFVALVGCPPAHIDSHQHVHLRDTVRPAVDEVAEAIGVPVRGRDERVRHCGGFYGQTGEGDPLPDAVSVDALLAILASLPDGVTELGCHPGVDVGVETMYRTERAVEVATLCHERVRAAIDEHGIRLCAFEDL